MKETGEQTIGSQWLAC